MLIADPDRIRRHRKARMMSLRTVATLCEDCTHQAIADYENGVTRTIPEARAAKLSYWLGLPMEEVFRPIKITATPPVAIDSGTVTDQVTS